MTVRIGFKFVFSILFNIFMNIVVILILYYSRILFYKIIIL